MQLEAGGIDIFYVDESMSADTFVVCSMAFPFIRKQSDVWHIVWEDWFEKVRAWRKYLSATYKIPLRKELKGQKLASGRGRFREGAGQKAQLSRAEGIAIYRDLLGRLDFLEDKAIIGITGTSKSALYGYSRLEALVYALLQRMRTACDKNASPLKRQGMVFFDQGHGEYRKLYRRARVHLPTGSSLGAWSHGGLTTNLPLANFTKDANIKESKHSFMIQIADLVSYALLLKIRGEQKLLTGWQAALHAETLYGSIPLRVKNTSASYRDPEGIVRL